MKFIVYLTTNLESKINNLNKIYVGVHKTENPEIFDGYIGCGVYIQQPSTYMYPKTPFLYAVKKYGVHAFKRTILYVYDTAKEAFEKEEEIVDLDFVKASHTYNACLGGGKEWNLGRPIYQFDLNGNLIKKWEYALEAYEFYGVARERFNYAIFDKHPLFDCIWSNKEEIDPTEYVMCSWSKVTHLYDKNGKWIKEFVSRKECADFLGIKEAAVVKAVALQRLTGKEYYVSDSLVDEFIPKPRKQYAKELIYVYNNKSELIGQGVGKEIMPLINCFSWQKIGDAFRYKGGWYDNFYLSTEQVNEVPERIVGNKIKIDVYTKFGDFIETLDSIKAVREKYNVPSSKIKNIELGNRYFENYIFKYHNKK